MSLALDCWVLWFCVIAAITYYRSFQIFWDYRWKWRKRSVAPTCIQLFVRLNIVSGKIFTWTCPNKSLRVSVLSNWRVFERQNLPTMPYELRYEQLVCPHSLAEVLCAVKTIIFHLFFFFQKLLGGWSHPSPSCSAVAAGVQRMI